jgi:hypothetical protein
VFEPLPGPLDRESEPEPESPEPELSPLELSSVVPGPGPLEPEPPEPEPLDADPLELEPSSELGEGAPPGPESRRGSSGPDLSSSRPRSSPRSRPAPERTERRTGSDVRAAASETGSASCGRTTGAVGTCVSWRTSPPATPTPTVTTPAAVSFATTAAAPPAVTASAAPGAGLSLATTLRTHSTTNATPTNGRLDPSSRSTSRRRARWSKDSTAGPVSPISAASSR